MGDQNTADVKLHLLDEKTNPLYLHYKVLKNSQFKKANISDCQTFDNKKTRIQIKVRTSEKGDNYTKCLQLMYSNSIRLSFSSMDKALAIILVACKILFIDSIEQCMEYLDGLPWTSVQEEKL